MAAQKYRKKPGEIEAMQWTGTNLDDIREWAGAEGISEHHPGQLLLTTIHGEGAVARIGDWIIPEPQAGRFWPCPDAVFGTIYEPCEEAEHAAPVTGDGYAIAGTPSAGTYTFSRGGRPITPPIRYDHVGPWPKLAGVEED